MNGLPRTLGFRAALAIIIGSIIGSGIFMKPSSMAAELGSPVWLSIVWVVAGVFTLAGALIYAELGAMWPETGGLYRYFKKIFGDFVAFLYGWSAFSVINTASVAAISFVCAEYTNYFLRLPGLDPAIAQSVPLRLPFIGTLYPLENASVKLLAIFYIVVLTGLSARTTKGGSGFQVFSTAIKVLLIISLILGLFLSGAGNTENFFRAEQPAAGIDLLTGLMIALTGAFFAYDGWTNVTFVAGEIRDPQKNLPRSLLTGTIIIIGIYLLINQAYLYIMPVEAIAQSRLVAADAIEQSIGANGAKIIALMVIICTLGAVNGNAMASPRVTYAMSKDGLFFSRFGKESRRGQTPANALWLHATWIILFIITGSFNMLADMFVFITWLAYMIGAIGVMLLRKKMPDADRPFRMPLYPWLPILFILFTGFYLVFTIVSDVRNYINDEQPVINSLLGLVLALAGVPVYYISKRRTKRKSL
jgi:APA family basic amino acid/polyamine antiporter